MHEALGLGVEITIKEALNNKSFDNVTVVMIGFKESFIP